MNNERGGVVGWGGDNKMKSGESDRHNFCVHSTDRPLYVSPQHTISGDSEGTNKKNIRQQTETHAKKKKSERQNAKKENTCGFVFVVFSFVDFVLVVLVWFGWFGWW